MKAKLFDYVERHNVIYDLSGVTKLFCFLFLTAAVMFSYDIRAILVIMALSILFLRMSQIQFRQIKLMLG